MNVIGIVCEYNPLHNGHLRQIRAVRNHYGEDCVIVCAMSGNYVQRGAPAIFDKSIRAKAAILAGCDLVLELPVTTALSSAEGFARGGVEILARCCDTISFGTESMDVHSLFSTAKALLSDEFSAYLRDELSSGCSFPSARQAALRKMSLNVDLSGPNDILGVEYCKAIMENGLDMQVFPVFRNGSYHSQELEEAAPSATAVRREILSGGEWKYAIPENLYPLFEHASVHTLEAGERAILGRLRTMTDEEFEALPYGSEGLWRKLMKTARTCPDLVTIIDSVKSKRYTRTRIDRMILCAFLGLRNSEMGTKPETCRVLAFNDRGRMILRSHPEFRNVGEEITETETRFGDLYGLFSLKGVDAPGIESKRRVYYHKESSD